MSDSESELDDSDEDPDPKRNIYHNIYEISM